LREQVANNMPGTVGGQIIEHVIEEEAEEMEEKLRL
jgi:hypothetical protein